MAMAAAIGMVLVLALGSVSTILDDAPTQTIPEPEVDEEIITPPAPTSEPTLDAGPSDGASSVGPVTPSVGDAVSDDGRIEMPHMPLDPANARPWTPGSAQEALAFGLTQSGLEPQKVRNLLVDYFHQSGFPVPPSNAMQAGSRETGRDPPEPPSRSHFEPNDTLMYSHNVGDADGDGFEDVAINAFCVTYECQAGTAGSLLSTFPPPDPTAGAVNCGTPQQVYVKSGRDGELIWDIDLSRENNTIALDVDKPLSSFFCPIHIVMGTIPVGLQSMDLKPGALPPSDAKNSTALLVYSVGAYIPPVGPLVAGNPMTIFLEHQVYALDSATGERLWTHSEDGLVVMWDGCGVNGAPAPDLTGLLSLQRRCTPLGSAGSLGNPVGILLGGNHGDQYNSKIVHAENLLVNPLVTVPKDNGVQVYSNATPSLFLQGVSFDYGVLAVWPSPPGWSRGLHVVDDYRPDEWLGRLDLNDGQFMWQAPSVTAEDGKSIMPFLINAHTPGVPYSFFTGYQYEGTSGNPWDFAYQNGIAYEVDVATMNYWRHSLCCFDITGDGIPDLVYSTQEWHPMQLQNEGGSFRLDSRIIAFSGGDGSRIWESEIANDVPRFAEEELMFFDAFNVDLELVGDADGDGLDDVMVHKYYLREEFLHEIEIRSGKDGSLVWGLRSSTHKLALPLGDTDGDGTSDVAIFDWFDWDYPMPKQYDLANVTAHPIQVRSGADGHVLWETKTFNAPLDVFYILDGYKTSGLNDFDGDGVVDFSIDDPDFLEDQTAIHRLSFLSGATGEQIFFVRTLGTYSFPVWAGDTTGDGVDDFMIFSGEVSDIWVTNYDGATGKPVWSQRFMTINANDFLLAVPRIGVLNLDTEAGDAPLVTLQLRIQTSGGFILTEATYPQVTAFKGTGHRSWNYPSLDEPELYQAFIGGTPAAQLFEDALEEQKTNSMVLMYDGNSKVLWKGVVPSIGAFLGMFLVSFKISDVLRARRRAAIGGDAEW